MLVGAGVVGLGVSAWLFLASGSDYDQSRAAPTYDGVDTHFGDAQSKRIGAWVALGAGTGLIGAGLWRLFAHHGSTRAEVGSRWAGAALFGSRGALGLALESRF